MEPGRRSHPSDPKLEEILKGVLPVVFGSWSAKCSSCVNYSGSPVDCGYCRVWGAVIPQNSRLTRSCPHWTSREALKAETPVAATASGF